MAKRSQGWTEEKIARYLKEGRGQGEGKNYKPWLTIQDVPSSGRSHRFNGIKTGRIHHLLSDLERDYFYILDWADDVLDVREQFPLDRERTVQISEQRNIKHPVDKETQTPIVMTTDFPITVRRGNKLAYLARTIKPTEHLNNARTIEKFEIERDYWAQRNVDWGIVTEEDIPRKLSRNISYFHPSYHVSEETVHYATDLLAYLKRSKYLVLSDVLDEFEHVQCLEKGEALTCFKHLVARKQIKVDLNTAFTKRAQMSRLEFVSDIEQHLGWGT